MKLNLGSGRYPLEGFENLNEPEWVAPELTGYADCSVEAVTISHLLMYLTYDVRDWLFAECYRVLVPKGVIRVTEDDADDPRSSRYGGANPDVYRTSPATVIPALALAGFHAYAVAPDWTCFHDDSLIQRFHGEPPDVFHCEGLK